MYRFRARVACPEQEGNADSEKPPPVGSRCSRDVANHVDDGCRKTAACKRCLGAVRVHEAKRATEYQAERQEPQEQPIGDPSGENACGDATVSLRRPEGNCERYVPCAGASRACNSGRESGAGAIVEAGLGCLVPIH